jgi:phosphotransferase system enzyme I (PtsI)
VLRRLRPRPVTIRTLDVGGDKFASYLGTSRSDNPFLGVRGIRFLLQHRDVLRTQVRAIYRASAHGQAEILFPMISSVEEVREVGALCDEVRAELEAEGHRLAERIPRGIMIEVPAAVSLADLLAREVDFFSIGSNDLIQYTLAVDRANQKVAHLYDPFHPAVLRAFAATIEAANRAQIKVSSCGELSGNPYGAAVLLGLGCSSLSMSPIKIRSVKSVIRKIQLVDLRGLAAQLLLQPTGDDVRRLLAAALEAVVEDGGQTLPGPAGALVAGDGRDRVPVPGATGG